MMTTPPHDLGPRVIHRLLLDQLRSIREKLGLSQAQAARELDWSSSKFLRFENGHQKLPQTELQALIRLYSLEGTSVGMELQEWGRLARVRCWWDRHNPRIPQTYAQFVAMEYGARKRYHGGFLTVPDLLRTSSYSSIVDAFNPVMGSAEETTRVVQERVRRSQATTQDVFVIAESVLLRGVGKNTDPHLMSRQLSHILDRVQATNSVLHVVPMNSDYHPIVEFDFVTLTFGNSLAERSYLRVFGDSPVVEVGLDLATEGEINAFIADQALTMDDSLKLLEDLAHG